MGGAGGELFRCSRLKWELSEVEEDIRAATSNLSSMIQDSDLLVKTMGYGKAVPKKLKLSPDGWFQVTPPISPDLTLPCLSPALM